MTGLTPEMALVAACCRWPPSPARDDAVRAAAVGVDWAAVGALIVRHRVHPLAFAALSAADVTLPATIARPLMRRVARTRQANKVMADESVRLQTMLADAGIPSLVVKGTPLALLAYGALTLKHAKDIDLLVPPERVPEVVGTLERDGYALWHPAPSLTPRQLADVVRYDRELEFVHRDRAGLQVELHWGLSRNRHILPGLDAHAPAQRVALGDGRTIRTLRRDDLFAYLCVHGASHGWFRLKWLADVAALAGDDAEPLYRAAVARQVGPSAGQALLLAEDLLALRLPPALSAALRADATIRRVTAAARDLIAGPGAERELRHRRFGQLRLQYAQWLTTRDFRDFRANLAQYMTVTGDVLAVPLPRRLHFLYPLLRVPLGIGRLAARKRSAVGADDA